MTKFGIATPLALATALLVAVAAYGAEHELTLKELVDRVDALGLGSPYEVEREDHGYEVKVRNAEGMSTKLFLDAHSGEILQQKRADHHRWQWPWKLGDEAATAGDLAMAELVDRADALGLGSAYEVEREKNGYEVRLRDAKGVRSKLLLDARSGEVLRRKRLDDDGDCDDDDDD